MFPKPKYQSMSDEALLAALQRGRQKALGELYGRHSGAVRHYFHRMTGQDAELARDLCQDLFLRVAEKCGTFQQGRSFKTWLYSIAHNMCKNLYRHREVRQAALRDIASEVRFLPSSAVLAAIDEASFRARIDATLAQLDPDRRSAFLLRHREGMSLREIAEVQACPLGTVKSRLHHAHQFLARQLADLKPEILQEDDALR